MFKKFFWGGLVFVQYDEDVRGRKMNTQEEHIGPTPLSMLHHFLQIIAQLKNYDQRMKLNMICNLTCTTN